MTTDRLSLTGVIRRSLEFPLLLLFLLTSGGSDKRQIRLTVLAQSAELWAET